MKTLKKIIGLAMAMVMMAMSFAAYAEITEEHIHDGCCVESVADEEEGIMPLGEICSCGSNMIRKTTSSSYDTTRPCTHGAIGNDTIRVTQYYYYYKCSSCGTETYPVLYQTTETVIRCVKG